MNDLADSIKRLRSLDEQRTLLRNKMNSSLLSMGDMERSGLMGDARRLDSLWDNATNEMYANMNQLVELVAEMRSAMLPINGFAQHDEDCTINDWANIPECKCGYTDAWGACIEATTKADALLNKLGEV